MTKNKKLQKKSKIRCAWEINPKTRVKKSKKIYSRSKEKFGRS